MAVPPPPAVHVLDACGHLLRQVINKKRTEKPEVRKASREAALREVTHWRQYLGFAVRGSEHSKTCKLSTGLFRSCVHVLDLECKDADSALLELLPVQLCHWGRHMLVQYTIVKDVLL